jgi:ectoine hydroxylase-related dioxygenase (phytanoyl-CoA dioxygenase family)
MLSSGSHQQRLGRNKMIHDKDWSHFDEHGYVLAKGILQGEHLRRIQDSFEHVWETEAAPRNQHKLLKHQPFIELIEHPPILQNHRAIFGAQIQLLQYDLLRQEPHQEGPLRSWHRDFSFPGDHPLSINTIVYLDEMSHEKGPTHVLPGSHRGWRQPPTEDERNQPLEGEVAIGAEPGDAAFINSAIWHSGGINRSAGLRRGIYLYYGHWWLKRYEWQQAIPWQALENADEQRLQLLGMRQPGDLHIYPPDALRNRDHI